MDDLGVPPFQETSDPYVSKLMWRHRYRASYLGVENDDRQATTLRHSETHLSYLFFLKNG